MADRKLAISVRPLLWNLLFVPGLLALLMILAAACAGVEEANPTPTEETPVSGEPIAIKIYSSSTKEDWMNAASEAFNQEQVTTVSGKPIKVEVFHVSSGGSQRDIIAGAIQPTVWSPGELSWVESANEAWQATSGRLLVNGRCRPTVYEPTGFAMWRPMAEAMGWPEAPIQWNDIFGLAADPGGWARYGHPEWGQFRIGLTNPETSNSGRLILTGLIYSTLSLTGGLTPEIVRSEPVVEALRQINLHTAKFGTQSAVLLEEMVSGGPSQLHAINTNEAETLKSNARYGKLLPFPLVFVIPAGGTNWGEHPYCILDTDWVSDEQREAANIFAAYLLAPQQQMLAVEKGLRPSNPAVELGPPISVENGANPGATPLTTPALESPSAAVAETIQALFVEIKDSTGPDQDE